MDIISLGAGVQSSTLLLMADRGEIKINGETIIPTYAIMSDTGNEPEKVYKWVEFLQSQVKNIKIIITNNGHIVKETINGITYDKRFASIPFYTKSPKGKIGMLRRQCSSEYKIKAIRKEIRNLLGYTSKQRVKERIRLWMGISTDEIERAKPSQVQYINNYFPLIDYEMSRTNCLEWFTKNELPLPPKSSCIICPYHSNDYWQEMKENDSISWEQAIQFDQFIRNIPKIKQEVYLHRSCTPLNKVNFNMDPLKTNHFINECEGICGI